MAALAAPAGRSLAETVALCTTTTRSICGLMWICWPKMPMALNAGPLVMNAFEITRAECIQLLSRLDRLKFLELQPGNRIKLLVSRTFSWRPDGPIQRFFNEQAHNEYFRSRFDRTGEFMLVVNGMLTESSSVSMVEKLKRIAHEFSALHNEDVGAPLAKRSAVSLLVAIRHWELQAFADMRRKKAAARAV